MGLIKFLRRSGRAGAGHSRAFTPDVVGSDDFEQAGAPWSFSGFPYLATYLVPGLYHISLLPAGWSSDDLVDYSVDQTLANGLKTCLVGSGESGTFLNTDGSVATWEAAVPTARYWVASGLRGVRPIPWDDELLVRARRLNERLQEQLSGAWGLLGDISKGGRYATPADVALLRRTNSEGLPGKLTRCASCGEARGICLDEIPPPTRVVTVHCACENLNRCAGCGELLAERKLNGNYLNEVEGLIWHFPAFNGLDHACDLSREKGEPGSERSSQ